MGRAAGAGPESTAGKLIESATLPARWPYLMNRDFLRGVSEEMGTGFDPGEEPGTRLWNLAKLGLDLGSVGVGLEQAGRQLFKQGSRLAAPGTQFTQNRGPQLKQQKLTTSSGQMIKTYQGSQGEMESVFTKVEPQHIGTGTPTNQASRNLARSIGNSTDDAGHGLGKNLGGPGDVASGNIFPQAPNINRGAFNQFEQQIARRVAAGDEVYVRVIPRYAQGSTRPFEIEYQVRINGKTITRTFSNQ